MANSVSNQCYIISFYSVIYDNYFSSNYHYFIFFRQGQAPFYHGGAPFLHHPVVPILPPPAPRIVIVQEHAPPEPEPVSYAELRAFWDWFKACQFDLGLGTLGLDPVAVTFFKKLQVLADPVVVNFFDMQLIQHL